MRRHHSSMLREKYAPETFSPRQLHTLFRIIADSKGYRRLLVEIVAQQLGGLWHRTTITGYYEGRIPTRQGLPEQFKRKPQAILRRKLKYNTENFPEIMRRLADEHPEFAENVETITRILLLTEEEEEGPKPRKKPPKNNNRNTHNRKNKQQVRMHRTQSDTEYMRFLECMERIAIQARIDAGNVCLEFLHKATIKPPTFGFSAWVFVWTRSFCTVQKVFAHLGKVPAQTPKNLCLFCPTFCSLWLV